MRGRVKANTRLAAARMPGVTGIARLCASTGLGATSGRVKKAPQTNRTEYATVSTEPRNAPMRAAHAHGSPADAESTNAVNTASFATKPSSGGTPAIEAAATIAMVAT